MDKEEMRKLSKEEIEKRSIEFTDKLIEICNEYNNMPALQVAHDLLVGGISLTLKNTKSKEKAFELVVDVMINCTKLYEKVKCNSDKE